MAEVADPEFAWAAFERRDRGFDGQFVGAVRTTRIYCKPSCPARRPLRSNVEFFADGVAAREAGYRACLRCKPDDVSRDHVAVERAKRILKTAEEPVSLQSLAEAVGYAPHHFQRLFKRATGLSPAEHARFLRSSRAQLVLRESITVTDAIYDAGYASSSRFYADVPDRLGMTPSAWRKGGAGVTILWANADTKLGTMLLATTDRGICRLSFDEDETDLRRRFPNAVIEAGGAALDALVRGAIAAIQEPAKMAKLPLDVGGTAFQQAVWRELARVPAGETVSYAALAARAGNPRAVRAAGTACGANQVAVLIPCHRALRTDGSLGGYAYGLDRKIALLAAEKEAG